MRLSLLTGLAAILFAMGIAPRARADFKVIGAQPAPKPRVAPPAAPRPGFVPIEQLAAKRGTGLPHSSDGFGLVAVTFVGTPPPAIEVRNGMGRNVPLAEALRQIAPPGWHGYGRPDSVGWFDPNRLVSWKGGRPWTDVLDILANEQNLAIEVDWSRKQLYIGKRAVPAGVATAVTSPKPVPVPLIWTAQVGSTLRTTFEQWAKRAGWTVVWPMEDLDYKIVAPLSFDGSIADAVGKLTRLYESAERPIAVDIRPPQKLLLFSEKKKGGTP